MRWSCPLCSRYLLVQFSPSKSMSFCRGLIISLELLLFWSCFLQGFFSSFFWIRYRAFLITEYKFVKSQLLRKTPVHRPLPSPPAHFQVQLKSNTQPAVPHTCPWHHAHTNLPENHRLPQRHPFPSELASSRETCTASQRKSGRG